MAVGGRAFPMSSLRVSANDTKWNIRIDVGLLFRHLFLPRGGRRRDFAIIGEHVDKLCEVQRSAAQKREDAGESQQQR
jgi:hypothetical protein